MAGWVRVAHPFPSLLDGLVVAAVALVAGGDPRRALTAATAMTLLQLGIGTLNDVVDAPFDAGRKAGKPIPAGLVPAAAARRAAVALFAAGALLASTVATSLAVLAVAVVGIGLAYDLRLKGGAWSWLPFAIGIPILPVFGWLAARPTLEPFFVVLVPAAVAAGAALAIGNAAVDVERDRAAGRTSIAAAVGEGSAALVVAGLLAGVAALAVVSAAVGGAPGVPLALIAVAGVPGVIAAVLARGQAPAAREAAWRVEAIGTGLLAVAWLWAILGAPRAS